MKIFRWRAAILGRASSCGGPGGADPSPACRRHTDPLRDLGGRRSLSRSAGEEPWPGLRLGPSCTPAIRLCRYGNGKQKQRYKAANRDKHMVHGRTILGLVTSRSRVPVPRGSALVRARQLAVEAQLHQMLAPKLTSESEKPEADAGRPVIRAPHARPIRGRGRPKSRQRARARHARRWGCLDQVKS